MCVELYFMGLQFDLQYPDSKVYGANLGSIWVIWAPDEPMLAPWTLLSGLFHYRKLCNLSKPASAHVISSYGHPTDCSLTEAITGTYYLVYIQNPMCEAISFHL